MSEAEHTKPNEQIIYPVIRKVKTMEELIAGKNIEEIQAMISKTKVRLLRKCVSIS